MSAPQQKLDTRKVFETICYSALHWPGKTTSLAPSSLEAYLQRPGLGSISIAELYHENSKLHPAVAASLLATRTDGNKFRHETLVKAAAGRAVNRHAPISVPERLEAVLRAAQADCGPDLFYAVELRVLIDHSLFLWEPLGVSFTVLKQLAKDDLATLHAALEVMGSRTGRQADPLLIVLGWFARNELLLGARGYRRTLLEVGRAVQALVSGAGTQGIRAEILTEFTDIDLDAVVEADGVEQGTVAVIALE
jgi:hypothetical protein